MQGVSDWGTVCKLLFYRGLGVAFQKFNCYIYTVFLYVYAGLQVGFYLRRKKNFTTSSMIFTLRIFMTAM